MIVFLSLMFLAVAVLTGFMIRGEKRGKPVFDPLSVKPSWPRVDVRNLPNYPEVSHGGSRKSSISGTARAKVAVPQSPWMDADVV